MVTKAKTMANMANYHRLGTVLIWLGVFVWAPYIFLRVLGEDPAFLWFLPFHLLGVVGGSRVRSMTRKELNSKEPGKNALHKMGHGLIFMGILVWLPYFYMKLILEQPVEVMVFLPFHLTGVLGGVALHIVNFVIGRFSAKKD